MNYEQALLRMQEGWKLRREVWGSSISHVAYDRVAGAFKSKSSGGYSEYEGTLDDTEATDWRVNTQPEYE